MYAAKIFYAVLITLLKPLARIAGIETPPLNMLDVPVKQLIRMTYDAGEAIPALSDNWNCPAQCLLRLTSLIVDIDRN